MSIRVKEAADILQVSKSTVRNWCRDGILPYSLSAAGQKVFKEEDLVTFKNERLGITPPPTVIIHYARSSNKNDIAINTQLDKLKTNFGNPDCIFTDHASGLNENRTGLKALFKEVAKNQSPKTLYITNKDRLTRFGFSYLEQLLAKDNCSIIVLDSDDTKEPLETLMQDFMSLLASFSGKFYRIRGWEQQKKFLKDAADEVRKREKKQTP